jgi:hypothetical protein
MPHDFKAATLARSMTAQFLKRLLARFCRHRFSWPHTGVHGQDYQVCLDCGAVYGYDCTTMQRTGRLTTSLTADTDPYPTSGPPTSEVAAEGRELIAMEGSEVRDDLVQDMIEVLTSFCARLCGRRFARNKAKKAVQAIEQ